MYSQSLLASESVKDESCIHVLDNASYLVSTQEEELPSKASIFLSAWPGSLKKKKGKKFLGKCSCHSS